MLMLAALSLAAAVPEVSSEKLADGGYRILLTAPGLTLEQGRARAMAEALRLCGYVVWRRQRDGSFQLVREEQNIVERASAPDMTPEKLAQIRSSLGCREPS
jgi:hypothetical protein